MERELSVEVLLYNVQPLGLSLLSLQLLQPNNKMQVSDKSSATLGSDFVN